MRRVLALTTAAALTGCAVGPNYDPPKMAGPPAFATAMSAVAAPAATPDQWWRLYNDPVLDGLVQQALAENSDLQIAAANLAQARAFLDQARVGLFPSTRLSAGDAFGRTASANAAATARGQRAVNQWAYSAGLDVSYEVDLFGRVRRSIESARANAAALAATQDFVRVTVAAETTRAYANACAIGEQVAVARRSVDLVQQGYDITVRQRDAGGLSDFDVARQATLLAQARAVVPRLESQRLSSLYQLAVLTGRTPETLSPQADACRVPPMLKQPIPVGDGAGLLRRRPDVAQAERNLAAATARIGVATANLFPTVSLGAGVSAASPNLNGLGRYQNVAFGVGPLISWSFPNTLVAQAQIRAAEAQASGALAGFNGAVLGALKETEQALAAYGGELDRNAALAVARDQASEAQRLAQIRFEAGGISFMEVLDSERTLVQAQSDLAASDATLVSNQVSVFKALGGGWQDSPAVKAPVKN